MSNSPLRVIARVKANVTHEQRVCEILAAIVEPTRQEPGCLSYCLLENRLEAGEFSTVEEWASTEAEQAHFSTPHIQTALQQLSGLLAAEPDIRRYRVVK